MRCAASASCSAMPTPRRGARAERAARPKRPALGARRALRRPRLPAEPYHRKYGLRVGRPVDRVYIEGFLERHAADVRGRVLEIYDSRLHRALRRRRGSSAPRCSTTSRPRRTATVSGDLESGAGLPREAFDCFICTQTLSLIYDVRGGRRQRARAAEARRRAAGHRARHQPAGRSRRRGVPRLLALHEARARAAAARALRRRHRRGARHGRRHGRVPLRRARRGGRPGGAAARTTPTTSWSSAAGPCGRR